MLTNVGTSINRIKHVLARPFRSGRLNRGMTLLEIIIVVALLGTLMTILVRNLAGTADNAKIDQATLGMGGIAQSLQLYRVHNNRYPTTAQGLEALLTNPGSSPRWRGPYIEANKLNDPWATPYGYTSDGRKYEIISAGPSGVMDNDDDIFYPAREQNE